MKSQMRRLQIGDRRQQARAAYIRILRKASHEPNSPCVRRVLQLLELMKDSEILRLQLYEHWKSDFDAMVRAPLTYQPRYKWVDETSEFTEPDLQAMNIKFEKQTADIEKRMKRYNWHPTIRPFFEFHSLEEMYVWRKKTANENWENWAVLWLMRHVKGSGRSPAPILRFRKCRQCSAWFYALTDHQTHCTAKCRQKFHAQSEEFRAKRAAYMREKYRPREKDCERLAKVDVRKKR